RCFSTTARANAVNSHIGREPIVIPPSVTIQQNASTLAISGPLGATHLPIHPFVSLAFSTDKQNRNQVAVSIEDGEIKQQRQMWGTTRTLLANAVTGMSEGFKVSLHLVGVGYRVQIEADPRPREGMSGQRLNMKLGFSHLVTVPIPDYIKAEVPFATRIDLFCTDKQKLGQFAADVRKFRKPEPYKGKGIFVGKEQIRIKNVKKR
ncbi:ribosomal protein L6, partial [Sistotremastrum niveocremeum HHB9708]